MALEELEVDLHAEDVAIEEAAAAAAATAVEATMGAEVAMEHHEVDFEEDSVAERGAIRHIEMVEDLFVNLRSNITSTTSCRPRKDWNDSKDAGMEIGCDKVDDGDCVGHHEAVFEQLSLLAKVTERYLLDGRRGYPKSFASSRQKPRTICGS